MSQGAEGEGGRGRIRRQIGHAPPVQLYREGGREICGFSRRFPRSDCPVPAVAASKTASYMCVTLGASAANDRIEILPAAPFLMELVFFASCARGLE